jgi:flagellar hook-associated protein 3 FlgL
MRISTSQSWQNAQTNLAQSQAAQDKASNQFSTQKLASDLKGFGPASQLVSNYRSDLAKSEGYGEVAKSVANRLSSQNNALEQLSTSAQEARNAILQSVATGRAEALTTALSGSFSAALEGFNYKHQGQYLLSGGNEDEKPVTIAKLTDLSTITAADAFSNGFSKKSSQIDGQTHLQTGQVASEIGGSLMDAFKAFQDYIVANPLSGTLSETQISALQSLSTGFADAFSDITDQTAMNGNRQAQVEATQGKLSQQSLTIEGNISDTTQVDLTTAYSKLQQAQLAVQASSQIIATLKQTTLLDYLR